MRDIEIGKERDREMRDIERERERKRERGN